jgi:uncharacterized protein YbaP (TraB family)
MNMKKHILTLIIALLIGLPLHAEETGKLYLWKSEKNGKEFYLLGSVHTVKEDLYPLDLQIESAFNKSDKLVLETMIDSLNPFAMVKMVSYSDGTTLKSRLKPETYKQLMAMAKEEGIPESYLINIKPWYAILVLTISKMEKAGIKAEIGIDSYFESKAKENKKEILQLETPTEQLKYLTAFEKMSDDYIDYSIEEMEKVLSDIEDMLKAWQTGDDELMQKDLFELSDKFPEINEINEKILYERNVNMAERIDKMLDNEGKYFIIVGTAHLLGERSVIDLLEKEGYEFERLDALND